MGLAALPCCNIGVGDAVEPGWPGIVIIGGGGELGPGWKTGDNEVDALGV